MNRLSAIIVHDYAHPYSLHVIRAYKVNKDNFFTTVSFGKTSHKAFFTQGFLLPFGAEEKSLVYLNTGVMNYNQEQ